MPGGAVCPDRKDWARWGESTVLSETCLVWSPTGVGWVQAGVIGRAACWCPGEGDNISKGRAEGGPGVSQHSPPRAVHKS